MEAAFDTVNYRRPDEHGELRVGFLAMGRLVDMCFGAVREDFQGGCESIKALSVAVRFILPRASSDIEGRLSTAIMVSSSIVATGLPL